MNLTPHALIFTLAAIGIAETSYLIRERTASRAAVCVIGHGCTQVLESKYNRIFGLHNDALGLLFYLALSVITGLLVVGVGPANLIALIAKLMIVGATCMSVVFIFIQWKLIRAWCFWCLMSAATIFLMMFIILTANLIA